MSLFPAYSVDNEERSLSPVDLEQSPNYDNFSSILPTSFASFAQPEPIITLDSSKSSTDGEDLEVVYEKKSTKKRKKHKKDKKKRHHRSRSPIAKPKPSAPKKPVWSFCDPDPNGICPFIIDRWRDLENLQFNSSYKRHVPDHFYFQQKCLGGDREMDKLFFKSEPQKPLRYFSRRAIRRKNALKDIVPINPTSKRKNVVLGSFIELIEPVLQSGEEKLVYDASIQMYRKVEDEPVKDQFDELDIQEKTKLINQRLHDDPHNVDLWLTFIKMQDQLVTKTKKEDERRLTERGLLERKMAIVERALAKNGSNIELKLLRMNIGGDLWEREKLKQEWTKMEFHHINQPAMWNGYLSFNEQHFSGFLVTKQIALYDRCLSKLQTVLSGTMLSHAALPQTEAYILECFMRRTYFLASCGQMEKAWASLQAVVEFNFFVPDSAANADLVERRLLFEQFLDSGKPRFGDMGSVGWNESVKNANELAEQSETNTNDEEISKIEDEFCQKYSLDSDLWSALETLRDRRHWMPWRQSEQEPEDPERTVLYDDIVAALILFKEPLVRFQLIVQILTFLGVQMPSLTSSNYFQIKEWQNLDRLLEIYPDLPPVHSLMVDLHGISSVINQVFEQIFSIFPEVPNQSYFICAFMSHVAHDILREDGNRKEKLKKFKKLAKEILKQDRNRNSLPCYLAYAQALNQFEAHEEASEVLKASLSVHSFWQMSETSLSYLVGIRMMTSLGHSLLLSNVLPGPILAQFILGQSNADSVTAVVKARHFLESRLENVVITDNLTEEERFLIGWLGSSFVHTTILLALLTYSTSDGPPKMSLTLLESATDSLISSKIGITDEKSADYRLIERNLELIMEFEVWFIENHLNHSRVAAPKLLRESLTRALEQFPRNPKLLKKFVDFSLKTHRVVELRQFFSSTYENDKSNVIQCLALLYAEFKRYVTLVEHTSDFRPTELPEINRLRQVLERSVESSLCSPLLWRLYMKFELLRNDTSAVQRLFYRAVRRCPWSKMIYIDTVNCLENKVQMITDLMIEKELRVRVPLEELDILRQAANQNVQENDENEESGDDEYL